MPLKTVFCLVLLGWLGCGVAFAGQVYSANQFCDAVYLAEGGIKAKKPYGVLSVRCDSEPECRQVCLNSYKNNIKRFSLQTRYTDFIDFFGSRWCPVGANNDPHGLNKNWIKNVKYFIKFPR